MSLASNILMGADAVKEFKVLTENAPVEYGEQSGGVTNTTFKSGTNNLHGTAFEYYRNSAFDARNFFDGPTVPPLHRHQFGGSVGGPIKKDNTFFYTDFEGLRSDAAASFVAPVPNLAARASAITPNPTNLFRWNRREWVQSAAARLQRWCVYQAWYRTLQF